jgi:hypothetical protein
MERERGSLGNLKDTRVASLTEEICLVPDLSDFLSARSELVVEICDKVVDLRVALDASGLGELSRTSLFRRL